MYGIEYDRHNDILSTWEDTAAIQLLWINLVMDTLAALALATTPPFTNIMRQGPAKSHDATINLAVWLWRMFTTTTSRLPKTIVMRKTRPIPTMTITMQAAELTEIRAL